MKNFICFIVLCFTLGSTFAQTTLTVTDDVRKKNSTITNDTKLSVIGTKQISYLKFDLSGLSGDISSADLNLVLSDYTNDGSGAVNIYLCDGANWTESNASTSNLPSYNTSTDQLNTNTLTAFSTEGATYTWTLDASKLSTGSAVTFAIQKSGGNKNDFYSRNSSGGQYAATLDISTGIVEPTCDDDIQNGDETGIDCGGTNCPACPTCSDGIQNGTETGVDCGGSCAACPTCSDGIQNGDELGIDCGGANCPTCPDPTLVNAWQQDDDNIYYIFQDGQVGIGTDTPDAMLTVGGNIHAQKVKVTVDAGADFVFQKGYQPPSLKEIEAFVKKNQHLPGIASEAEMQAEGLDVGEFHIQLLQKVEEMTLYLIEQQKEIEALKKEVAQLKKKN